MLKGRSLLDVAVVLGCHGSFRHSASRDSRRPGGQAASGVTSHASQAEIPIR